MLLTLAHLVFKENTMTLEEATIKINELQFPAAVEGDIAKYDEFWFKLTDGVWTVHELDL